MAFEQILQSITIEAGADLSTKQNLFHTIAADGQIDPTGDGLLADGVLQNNPNAAGQPANLAVAGISKVTAGAAITRGDLVASDSAGKAKTAVSTNEILGRALAAALADGDIIPVLLKLGTGRAPKP